MVISSHHNPVRLHISDYQRAVVPILHLPHHPILLYGLEIRERHDDCMITP